MAQEFIKPRGSTRGSRPDAGGANIRSVPVFGIVKDNIDPIRSGRLRVYISDFGGKNPDDSNNWVTVNYMSNFFGMVRPTANDDGYGTYRGNPASYGEWHAPPDIGTTVICIFINGDPNFGFYIGSVPDPETLHMVPAVSATLENKKNPNATENVVFNEEEANTYGGTPRIPVTNLNTNDRSLADTNTFLTQPKPAHSYTAAVMMQQGVIRDPIRGPISSSSQREATSRVGWGVSTPGRPIYEGGYDDETIANDPSKLPPEGLRIISRKGGHSIVMDDGDVSGKDQLIRIRTAKGHQITMSDDGETLTILHGNGQSYVELGKEGTVDVYSTNSVNVRTQGDLNLHADNNVNIHAAKDLNIHAENMNVATTKSLKQSIGLNYITSAVGIVTMKTLGAISLSSIGPASLSSTFTTFINGLTVNLNTGKTPIKPLDVTPTPLTIHTDTIFDEQKGFVASPGTLMSVTSRAPTHMPWAHAGQGVDLKISLTGNLPKSPSSLISNVVSQGLSRGLPGIQLPTTLSVPNIDSVKSLTKTATNALVGVAGQQAALGPLSAAVQQGAAIVQTSAGNVAAVGTFAQTPSQLVSAGVLKPGADKLVESLVNSGANITQAMPATLFTGNFGSENLQTFVTNIQPQTTAVVTNLDRSSAALKNAGVITGAESSEQIAGVIYAGASSGVDNTITAIKTTVNKNTVTTNVMNDICVATNSAVSAANTLDGVNSLNQSVTALANSPLGPTGISTNTGVTGAAFNAINNSFPVFDANTPINLLSSVSSQQAKSAAIAGVATSLAQNSTAAIASGVVNLPGGFDAISSFKDLSVAKLPLPGTAQLSNFINNGATNAINSITGSFSSLGTNITGSISSLTTALPLGSIMNITSAIGSIKSLFGGKGGPRPAAVAVNTVDRAAVDSKFDRLVSDVTPNPTATASFQDLDTKIQDLNVRILRLKQNEGAKILEEERSKPAGDPDVQRRKAEIINRINALIDERNELERQRDLLKR